MMSAQLYEYSDSSEEEPNNIQNQPQQPIQNKIYNAENFRKQNNNNKFNNISSSKPKPSVNKALNSPQPQLPPPSQINLHSNTFAQSQNSNNSSSKNKKIDIRSCYDNIEYSDEEDISSNNNEHKYNDNQLNSNHRYNKPRPTRRTPQTTPNDINNDFPKLFQHSYTSSAFNPWNPSNWKDKTKGYYILNKPGGLGVSHTNDKPCILDLTNQNDRGRGRGRGGRGRGRGWRGRGRGNYNRYGDNNRGYISHRDRGYNKYHDFGYSNSGY